MVDNYDSFVYNLVHYLQVLGQETLVRYNDDPFWTGTLPVETKAILVSPGPCSPAEAGHTVSVIRRMAPRVPVLGVCLGHQALGAAFGVPVIRAPRPVHGMSEWIQHSGDPLFAGMDQPFQAARYHSLVLPADQAQLGPLRLIATDPDGTNMAVRHREYLSYGVQFHPESLLTPQGMTLLANFLELAGAGAAQKPQVYG